MNSTLEGVIAPFFSSLISIDQSGKRVSRVIVVPFLVLVVAESVVPFGPAGKGFVLYSFRWSLMFYYKKNPDALH